MASTSEICSSKLFSCRFESQEWVDGHRNVDGLSDGRRLRKSGTVEGDFYYEEYMVVSTQCKRCVGAGACTVFKSTGYSVGMTLTANRSDCTADYSHCSREQKTESRIFKESVLKFD